MKIKYLFLILSFYFSSLIFAIDGPTILHKMDQNRFAKSEYFEGQMTIKKGNRTLIKTFKGYSNGEEENYYIVFTNPEDLGVKYLKLENALWIYFPDADDVLKISGSMLKQGMMGSDLSYEDMLSNNKLEDKYNVKLLGEEKIGNFQTYKLELIAKKHSNISYYKQILFIDKKTFSIVKAEYYAHSGRLLKILTVSKITKVDNKFIPTKMIFYDERRKNSQTIIEFKNIKLNISLPKNIFTLEYLKR